MTGKVQRKPFTKTLDKKRPAHANNSNAFKSTTKPFNKPAWKKPHHQGNSKVFKPFTKHFNNKNNKSHGEEDTSVANRTNPNIKGYVLEKSDFSFFFKILQQTNEPTSVAKDKETLANEMLEKTKGKEINFASSKIVSLALQNLFAYADAEHLERFFRVFGENLTIVFSKPFTSHALKTLVVISLLRARGAHKVNNEKDLINDGVPQAKRIKSIEPKVEELSYTLNAKFSKEHRAACADFVLTVNQYVLKNFDELMNSFKNRVMRICIRTLSGLYVSKLDFTDERYDGNLVGNRRNANLITTAFTVPSKWADLFKEIVATLQQCNQFKMFPYKLSPSLVISTVCTGLANVDKAALDTFGKTLVEDSFLTADIVNKEKNGKPLAKSKAEKVNVKKNKTTDDEEEQNSNSDDDEQEEQNSDDDEEPEEQDSDDDDANEKVEEHESDDSESEEEKVLQDNIPSVFKSNISMEVLENLISVASPKLLTLIFNTLFAGHIPSILNMRLGNFYITQMLNFTKDKQMFQKLFDLLTENFEQLISFRKRGIIIALSDACLRFDANKEIFLELLQKALHCTPELGSDPPKHFFTCILVLQPLDVLSEKPYLKICQNGVNLMANILQFDKAEILTESLLTADVKKLVELFKVENGNRVAAFVQKSPLISKKSRKNFVQLFVGNYADLAMDKNGSKSLEIIFAAADDVQKIQIAKELLESKKIIEISAEFVRIMHDVLRMTCTFTTAPAEWKDLWTTEKSENVKAVAAAKVVKKTPKNKKRKLVA